MLRPLVLAFAVSLLAMSATSPAHAEPHPSRKSPGFAVALSLGVTAGSIALGVAGRDSKGLGAVGFAGFLVGPSTGLWYAGRAASAGTAVRVAGISALVGSLVWSLGCNEVILDEEGRATGHEHGGCDGAGALATIGALALVSGTIWEVTDAYRTATEHNRRHGFDLAVTPTVMPTGRGVSPGLALTARF